MKSLTMSFKRGRANVCLKVLTKTVTKKLEDYSRKWAIRMIVHDLDSRSDNILVWLL